MNRFITRTTKPQTPKDPLKPSEIQNENETGQQSMKDSMRKARELLNHQKVEEPSLLNKLQHAIRDNDAQLTFDMLCKNRPFDNSMNKTMTKLEFAGSFSDPSSEFMILSVDEKVVGAFSEGQSVTIRGDSTGEAVLCTEEATFPMKIIESATSVLLLHNELKAPESPILPNFDVAIVDGKCFSSAELCAASEVLNVGRLKDMLREQELKWDWKEKEDDEMKGYRLRDLLESVQMSVGEVKTALNDLPVVKFPNGKYRYLSHKFRGEMMGLIVEMLDEEANEDVTLEAISFTGLREHLPENVPDQVIQWFLDTRCEKVDDNYRLPEAHLVRDLTVVILYGTQKMPLQQFQELLKKILPFGVNVNESYFEGVADISDAPFGKVITYLSPEDLPDTVKERLLFLFEYRKYWTLEQLRPYFQDIYKSQLAFDKYVVLNCDYSLFDSDTKHYCNVK